MKNSFKKILKSRFFSVIILLVVLIISSYFYEQKIFSFHFVDEEDNFVLGMYLNQDEKLYRDLFSHHQPFAYILSSVVQTVSNPTDIYKLVQRHREFMILWSIIWLFILTLRFGWIGPMFAFFYEFTKIYLLGNLFSSESLVVYPVIYLVVWCLSKQKNIKYEFLFLGFLLRLS